MPRIKTADGVALYYEESVAGTPVLFSHEFAATENGRWLGRGPPSA
jgi:hypothetical protein